MNIEIKRKKETSMDIIATAMSKKGQFASAQWRKTCKTLKACPVVIEKETRAQNIRVGCSYDNLKTTVEGRANGDLPAENAGLVGLRWVSYPVTLTNPKTGRGFIRIETAQNTRFESKYYSDGKEVAKEEIEVYLQASEKRAGQHPTVMNIPIESFIEIK
ncbi:MAG: hypothetical protein RR370_03710 [Synergistaceae bacterium]